MYRLVHNFLKVFNLKGIETFFSIRWLLSQNAHNTWGWQVESRSPKFYPSLMWVSGTQLLEPSLAAFQAVHYQKAGIGRTAWTQAQ